MQVVLAIDGSEDARAATGWLTEFPLPAATHVLVVTVVSLPHSPLNIPPVQAFNAEVLAAGRRVAADARAIVRARWADVDARTIEGDPREEIVATAEAERADLVVVGARGLGTVKGFLLGSVSTAVVREAPCPVLVVKGRARTPRSVLVAVDGSADSLAAARFLTRLSLDRSTALRLLGVVEPPRFPPGPAAAVGTFLLAELEELVRRQKAELDAVLTRLAEELRDTAGPVEHTVAVGTASDEILAAANDGEGVDLVVVGARGLGPVKRLVLGSVSERVVHHARCPVLVVKGPRRQTSSS